MSACVCVARTSIFELARIKSDNVGVSVRANACVSVLPFASLPSLSR